MNTYLRSEPTTSSEPGIADQSAAAADDADDDMNKGHLENSIFSNPPGVSLAMKRKR